MRKKLTTSEEPVVGMGATLILWSDRRACTIVQVTHNGKRIVIQRDAIEWTPDPTRPGQILITNYLPDPQGELHHVTKRKDGTYRLTGSKTIVRIGVRDEYYDPTF